MTSTSDNSNWKPEYSIVALLGISYIVLLWLFTWIFNHSI